MKKTDTREQIIKQAAKLFKEQGYNCTSVKQITASVGISAPALYYFFPGGKAELLRVVVRALKMDPEKILAELKMAQSLEELVGLINQFLPELLQVVATDIRWLRNEADQLPKEEKNFVQDTILTTFEIILTEARRFIPKEKDARRFVWMMMFIHNGYMELFSIFDVGEQDPFSQDDLNQAILDFIL